MRKLTWCDLSLPPLNLINYKQWDKTMYMNDSAYDFTLQPYQEDENWLKARRPEATEAQQETFAGKVAFAIEDNPNKSIDEIRATVYRVMGFLYD